MRQQYHTLIKQLVKAGNCPEYILQQIPYSTKYNWINNTNIDLYQDFDLNDINRLNELLLRVQQFPKLYFTIARYQAVFGLLFKQSGVFFATLRHHKSLVVNIIYRLAFYFDLHTICRWFRISIFTYREWKTEVLLPCTASVLKKCLVNKPNQLLAEEVEAIKALLTAPSYCHLARRQHQVFASLATWYKYNQLFEWRKHLKRFRKPKYDALRASHPNEYWHADVSLFRTRDGALAYIYVVMDNFSRKVLA